MPGYVLTKPIAQVDVSLTGGFTMYAMLRDAVTCEPVVNQAGFSYAWTIDDASIASINPIFFCINEVMPPCPLDAVDISPRVLGTTTIRATVTEIASGVQVARVAIPTTVYQRLPLP